MAALTGVEVWLNGSKDELRAAWAALHQLGTVTHLGELHPLEQPGRFRLYLRLTVAAAAIPPAPARPTGGTAPDTVSLPLAG
ncbi:hypothetical protein Athai_50870 [Actinocatenispora thailandica]|uniref:Uncharacterized protein n=1 Tax=Actinocatenispora thailandica TaxID=227318 RepID=A0A7R7DTK0_9ACTN|nr:hypothetical protein [Actinocatenispora thailandica]BCJ37584.1 hypothetical protein Athai_50870 [Actinocatenispora thailandica]